MTDREFLLHVIHEKTGSKLAQPLRRSVPRVGDEIRLNEDSYYRVVRVIWCYDERVKDGLERVNIGVLPA